MNTNTNTDSNQPAPQRLDDFPPGTFLSEKILARLQQEREQKRQRNKEQNKNDLYNLIIERQRASLHSRQKRWLRDHDGHDLVRVFPTHGPARAIQPYGYESMVTYLVSVLGPSLFEHPEREILQTDPYFNSLSSWEQEGLIRTLRRERPRFLVICHMFAALQAVERRLRASESISFCAFLKELERQGYQFIATNFDAVAVLTREGELVLKHGLAPGVLIRILRRYFDPLGTFEVGSLEFQHLVLAHAWAVASGLREELPVRVPHSVPMDANQATIALMMASAHEIRCYVKEAFAAFPAPEQVGQRYDHLLRSLQDQLPLKARRPPATPAVSPPLPEPATTPAETNRQEPTSPNL